MDKQEEAVRELLVQYRKAIWDKDLDSFLDLYDQELCVYDLWNVWSYEGLEAWGKMVKEWFSDLQADRDDVSFQDAVVKAGQDFATLYTLVTYRGMSATGVELRHMKSRMTWVLHKRDGLWKIIHEHSSGPVNMAEMKLMLE